MVKHLSHCVLYSSTIKVIENKNQDKHCKHTNEHGKKTLYNSFRFHSIIQNIMSHDIILHATCKCVFLPSLSLFLFFFSVPFLPPLPRVLHIYIYILIQRWLDNDKNIDRNMYVSNSIECIHHIYICRIFLVHHQTSFALFS